HGHEFRHRRRPSSIAGYREALGTGDPSGSGQRASPSSPARAQPAAQRTARHQAGTALRVQAQTARPRQAVSRDIRQGSYGLRRVWLIERTRPPLNVSSTIQSPLEYTNRFAPKMGQNE